jgi:hypothetical protein
MAALRGGDRDAVTGGRARQTERRSVLVAMRIAYFSGKLVKHRFHSTVNGCVRSTRLPLIYMQKVPVMLLSQPTAIQRP